MGWLSKISDFGRRTAVAAEAQRYLEQAFRAVYVEASPVAVAGEMTKLLLDNTGSTFGQAPNHPAPHKRVTAAHVLLFGVVHYKDAPPLANGCLMASGLLLRDMTADVPMTDYDRYLLDKASAKLEQHAAEWDVTPDGRAIAKIMAHGEAQEVHATADVASSEPPAVASTTERASAAARQGVIFMEACCLLGTTGRRHILGGCLFLTGAVDALAQRYKLDDGDFARALYTALVDWGVGSEAAMNFGEDLARHFADPASLVVIKAGGDTYLAWDSGRDQNAPLRYFELLRQWEASAAGAAWFAPV